MPRRLYFQSSALLLALAISASSGCTTYRASRLYQRGSASLDAQDPASAVADLERAAALAPHASEIHNHLGLAYAESGRLPEALQAFEHAVALDCDNAAAQHNLDWAREQSSLPAIAAESP